MSLDLDVIIEENNRLRTIIRETALILDIKEQCPDIDAYPDGHCSLQELAKNIVNQLTKTTP